MIKRYLETAIKKQIIEGFKQGMNREEIKNRLLMQNHPENQVDDLISEICFEQETIQYIKDCLNRGFTRDEVKNQLLKKRYPGKDINKFIEKACKKNSVYFSSRLLLFIALSLIATIIGLTLQMPIFMYFLLLSIPLLIFFVMNKDAKKAIMILVFSFFASELVFVGYDVRSGLILYSTFLGVLLLTLTIRNLRKTIQNTLIALTIIPLIRLLGSLMPVERFSFLARISSVYAIMIITSYVIFVNIGMKKIHANNKIILLPLVMLAGLSLGFIEFNVLQPDPLPTFRFFILIGFGATLLTGIAEEFIFRGLFQNLFSVIFVSHWKAIVFSNILFTAMHIVWTNWFELVFVFCAGLIHSWIYLRTRNLILISAMHGMINFGLFILYPLIM